MGRAGRRHHGRHTDRPVVSVDGDIRIVRGTAMHRFELDAADCRWLADRIPEGDMFRQELLDAAASLDSYTAEREERH